MDREALIQEMMKRGHERHTAEGAIAGRGIADLWREYMGGGVSQGQASAATNLPSAEEVANAVIEAVTESLPELPKISDNPFEYDEILAREAATAEYTPFYQEQLDEFLTDVDTRRQRGGAEERRLLEDLTAERDVGLAERGLTFSGEKQREIGAEIEPGKASPVGFMRDLMRRGRDIKVGTRELMEDLTKTAFRGEKGIGREKKAAIEGGVLQRRGEALESYLSGLQTQEEGAFLAQPLGVLGSIVP
jgi:hypothetical protein